MHIPKYRRHSANRAFVEWNGTREYLPGNYDSDISRKAYKAWLRRHGYPVAGDGRTRLYVWQLLDEYLHHAREYYGERHSEIYHCRSLFRALKHAHQTLADEFGPAALKGVRELMIELDWPPRLHQRPVRASAADLSLGCQ